MEIKTNTGAGTEILLEVVQVEKKFPLGKGIFGRAKDYLRVLDGVSVQLAQNRTLGVVGESGSGKSTLARVIMMLIAPDAGEVRFMGEDLCQLNTAELRQRRRHLQMVFQQPQGSFNSRFTVERIITEPMVIHQVGDQHSRRQRAKELLDRVGLAQDYLARYTHELSGGQNQRLAIARALSVLPKLIIADEAVSALDISVQAQILNLLQELQNELGISYIFISHDLNITCHLSDHIVVMYLGRVVESAPAEGFRENCAHPYTKALLSAALVADPSARNDLAVVKGEIGDRQTQKIGCAFQERCPYRTPICSTATPELLPLQGQSAHLTACFELQG